MVAQGGHCIFASGVTCDEGWAHVGSGILLVRGRELTSGPWETYGALPTVVVCILAMWIDYWNRRGAY